jgi:glycosyltransferase involved in cell wall biosynthesis
VVSSDNDQPIFHRDGSPPEKSERQNFISLLLKLAGEAKMKGSVLLVGNFLSSSIGNRWVCEDLAVQLAASGWSILTTSTCPGRLARLLDMSITVWHRRHRYDVAQVDVYSGLSFFWAEAVCWLLNRARKPAILTLHGGNLPAFAQGWPSRMRRLLRLAAAVTTPSGYLLEQMRPYSSDLHLLPNALDLSIYRFRQRENPQPHLVWLRAFHETYNPLLALKLEPLLVPDFPGIRLAMAGFDKGDRSLQRLQQLAADWRLADRITLNSRVPKAGVPDWLDKGDIFLNTSNVDNTPVSILEAMACGLCIVSTNVGGIPYLLEHEHDALLVPPDNPTAMATAVRRLLTEPALAGRLSRNARQKAERFDWSAILPQWEALLTSVTERHVA